MGDHRHNLDQRDSDVSRDQCPRSGFVTIYGMGFLMVIAAILVALQPVIALAEWIGQVLVW